MSEPLRKYAPIWETIKANGWCEISAHPAYHRRILKAVRKEKTQDLAYKMECLEHYPPIITTTSSVIRGSVIRFTLHTKLLITLDSI